MHSFIEKEMIRYILPIELVFKGKISTRRKYFQCLLSNLFLKLFWRGYVRFYVYVFMFKYMFIYIVLYVVLLSVLLSVFIGKKIIVISCNYCYFLNFYILVIVTTFLFWIMGIVVDLFSSFPGYIFFLFSQAFLVYTSHDCFKKFPDYIIEIFIVVCTSFNLTTRTLKRSFLFYFIYVSLYFCACI